MDDDSPHTELLPCGVAFCGSLHTGVEVRFPGGGPPPCASGLFRNADGENGKSFRGERIGVFGSAFGVCKE